jgi:Tol biopolymer transport system component
MKKLLALCCVLVPFLATAQPSTDIYLFDLSVKGGTVVLSKPRNVTPHPGYDNQPFFHPAKPVLYYAAAADSNRTDLRSYNYRKKASQPITATREREYSPTLTEDRQFLSCIIQRDNGNQDLGKYPVAGGAPTVLVNNLKVGYHAWIDRTRLLLFVLAGPESELHYHDLATGRDSLLARNIGRSLNRIPNQPAISFMQKTAEGKWLIQRFDTQTKAITTIAPGLEGSEYFAWTGNGLLLMSNGSQIFWRKPGPDGTWQPVTIKGSGPALKQASRLAVNSTNDKLAVVVSE